MLQHGWVSVIASDAHNLTHRAPKMTLARNYLCEHFGQAGADNLTCSMPAKILGIENPQILC
jgi:protein-tyrosine phosphatase